MHEKGSGGVKHGGFASLVLSPWRSIKGHWERFLGRLPGWLSPWVRDIVDVAVTVAVIIAVLKVLFGADMLVPLVVVTSESMVHEAGDNSWMIWLGSRGIGETQAMNFPMSGGFNMGDMIIVMNPSASLGDVIIYERDLDHMQFQTRDPIIHRIVGVARVKDYEIRSVEGTLDCKTPETLSDTVDRVLACQKNSGYCPYTRYPKTGDFSIFITKGDHNEGTDQCNKRLDIAYPVTDAQVTGRALIRLPYLGWPKLLLSVIYQIVTLQY